jgi:hypothetical protein
LRAYKLRKAAKRGLDFDVTFFTEIEFVLLAPNWLDDILIFYREKATTGERICSDAETDLG